MLTFEQVTQNVVTTKGLFAIPVEAFQFDWDKLYRIFVSTFHKYERYCPRVKTIQTNGGSPLTMPEDCIYPRAIGFGNALMIPPQSVAVDRQNWTYDRATRRLSVFTNTSSTSSFKVQYLARYEQIEAQSEIEPVEVYDDEERVEVQFDLVPNIDTLTITKVVESQETTEEFTLSCVKRCKDKVCFEGSLGEAKLDMNSLILTIAQQETSAGTINISYTGKYKAFDVLIDDEDFFETWYAANILSSLGNIKAILRMDILPNSISADDLISQGRELMRDVIDWQQSNKSHWWKGYISARV